MLNMLPTGKLQNPSTDSSGRESEEGMSYNNGLSKGIEKHEEGAMGTTMEHTAV